MTELEELRTFAREATKAITSLTPGGSEYFGKRVGDIYLADLPRCVSVLRDYKHSRIRLEKALRSAKQTMRNCQGAVESNQVDDKDIRRQLQRGQEAIDSALSEES